MEEINIALVKQNNEGWEYNSSGKSYAVDFRIELLGSIDTDLAHEAAAVMAKALQESGLLKDVAAKSYGS